MQISKNLLNGILAHLSNATEVQLINAIKREMKENALKEAKEEPKQDEEKKKI